MSEGSVATLWPAEIIHVNEDGWVLINRGHRHGLTPGVQLVVVGDGIRELRDPFAEGASQDLPAPTLLRIRRTYELLEVIHVADAAAIAIATRTTAERRPQVFRGPDGELLVWVPLPADFTSPRPAADGSDDIPAEDLPADADAEAVSDIATEQDGAAEGAVDAPPEIGDQDDERWEQALPLNGVNVGDLVLPAVMATARASAQDASGTGTSGNPFEAGRTYDWMSPGS